MMYMMCICIYIYIYIHLYRINWSHKWLQLSFAASWSSQECCQFQRPKYGCGKQRGKHWEWKFPSPQHSWWKLKTSDQCGQWQGEPQDPGRARTLVGHQSMAWELETTRTTLQYWSILDISEWRVVWDVSILIGILLLKDKFMSFGVRQRLADCSGGRTMRNCSFAASLEMKFINISACSSLADINLSILWTIRSRRQLKPCGSLVVHKSDSGSGQYCQ